MAMRSQIETLPVEKHPADLSHQGECYRRETTVAQDGTIMNATMVLSTDILGRTLWVDVGWPACDEGLGTVAEVNALRVGGATTQLPDVQSAGGRNVASYGR
jgi:hypothetical protein